MKIIHATFGIIAGNISFPVLSSTRIYLVLVLILDYMLLGTKE